MQLTGGIIDYFIVFLSGVLVSLTPCIYPVLPITASFIAGVNTKGTRWGGFYISLIYVLGMAVTYCSLGIFAALTGKIFGQFQNSPFIYLTISLMLFYFSFMMFDKISYPILNISIQNNIKKKTLLSIFIFGMVSGLIVGPCTAPVLGTILLYVGSKQNILHSISLLFVFSYGVGASLIVVGTFSGLLVKLPKSGNWMIRIKHICGLVLLVAALFYLFKAIFPLL